PRRQPCPRFRRRRAAYPAVEQAQLPEQQRPQEQAEPDDVNAVDAAPDVRGLAKRRAELGVLNRLQQIHERRRHANSSLERCSTHATTPSSIRRRVAGRAAFYVRSPRAANSTCVKIVEAPEDAARAPPKRCRCAGNGCHRSATCITSRL